MITKTGMYRTENLSHMDMLNLGCYGCGRCFVELKKKRKGRYQCFEQLYMNCSETEIHVGEIKNLKYSLDLSEYKDENGKIDYSRCIVEVK